MEPARVLVVEDAPEYAHVVSAVVEAAGHDATIVGTVADATDSLQTLVPDLVVLDLSLPDGDGLDLARHIRDHSSAYILMLTARHDEVDKVIGFKLGADDYVTKPFSPRELGARIEALVRRQRASSHHPADQRTFGHVVIDVATRRCTVAGEDTDLTRIEFDLLDLFSESPTVVYSRQQILDRVWGPGWVAGDHVVDVHIANLRKKIDRPDTQSVIRTVRGVGYALRP